MNMVSIGPYFKELDLVPLLDILANIFENAINVFVKDYSPVFGWKHQVIQQHRQKSLPG
jgi:hypothetical protein